MSTITATLQIRRDTAANWTSNNPTLLTGELGFETDTFASSGSVRCYKFKVGDGSTAWTSLPYSQLGDNGGGGGGSSAWGAITGTLSNQTDLQSALNAKANTSGSLSQFAATTSAQLASVLSDEKSAGSDPKAIFTDGTLHIVSGKTLKADNTLTFTGTDGTSYAFPAFDDSVMTGRRLVITTGDQSTTSNTAQDITGLSFTGVAGARYVVYGWIAAGCNNAGGVVFTMSTPASSTYALQVFGDNTSTLTVVRSNVISSDGTFTGAVSSYGNAGAIVLVRLDISLTNSGTVQFQFASGTATQTSSIRARNTMLNVVRVF